MCQPPNKMVDTEIFADQPANGPRFFNLDFRYSLLRSAIGGQLFKVGVSFTIDDFRNLIIALRMIAAEGAFHYRQSQKMDPSPVLQIPFAGGTLGRLEQWGMAPKFCFHQIPTKTSPTAGLHQRAKLWLHCSRIGGSRLIRFGFTTYKQSFHYHNYMYISRCIFI